MDVESSASLTSSEDEESDQDLEGWTHEEITALIDLWKESLSESKKEDGDSSFDTSELIATRLQQRLKKEVAYTGSEIQNKIEALKKEYR